MTENRSESYLLEKMLLTLLDGKTDVPEDAGKESANYYLDRIIRTLEAYGGLRGISTGVFPMSDIDAIKDQTDRIDNLTTLGLSGTHDSLAYRTGEIERHFHSYERWFEEAGTPTATHKADRIGTVGAADAFQIDAGNDTWGSWVQILGSEDTPAVAGNLHYDFHRLAITATERNDTYYLQIGFGESGAAALAANSYTAAIFKPVSNQIDSAPVTVQSRRQDAGTLAWARCMCPGQNTATIDFYFGLHEYEG